MSDTRAQVEELFRQVFGDPKIVLRDEMAIADMPGWDSMTHLNLMIAAEQRFKIRIAAAEISSLNGSGRNVGTFLALIGRKLERNS
jgi:acyl carrier protein